MVVISTGQSVMAITPPKGRQGQAPTHITVRFHNPFKCKRFTGPSNICHVASATSCSCRFPPCRLYMKELLFTFPVEVGCKNLLVQYYEW